MRSKSYKFIKKQIDDSIELKGAFAFESNLRDFESFYRGDFGNEEYVYNLYYSIFNSMIASIYPRNPRILVIPDEYEDQAISIIFQKLNNAWIREARIKEKIRQIILDICLAGFGALKVYSGGKFGRSAETVMYQMKRDFGEFVDVDISTDTSPDELHGSTTTDDETIRASRIHPADILFPYENAGPDVSTMRFISERYYRKVEHVKKDRRYIGTSRAKFSTVTFGNSVDNSQGIRAGEAGSYESEWVELYDFYCMETGKIYTIAGGLDKIIKIEDNVIDELPFVIFNWTNDPTYPYPQSDAKVIYDKQVDLITVAAQEKYFRETIKAILFVDRNKVDVTETNELMDASSPRGLVLTNGPPGQAVLFAKHAMPTDLFPARGTLEKDARMELGYGRNTSGEAFGSRTSAQEARIIAQGTSMRSNERNDTMMNGVGDACRIADKFRIATWYTPRSISVYGLNNGMPIEYTGESLQTIGELSYRSIMYEAPPESSEMQKLFVHQVFDRFAALGTPPHLLARVLARVFPEIPEAEEIAVMLQTASQRQVPQGANQNIQLQENQNAG
jgi:hypothetical protein